MCMNVWCCSSTFGVWAQKPTICAFSVCRCSGPWKGKRRIHQRRQDKHIIETSRNCYCQRFVSMHEKEKSIKLSIILSGGCGRPSGCPGQHDAPVQKLNARPALPSSSPTVDFPPLYLTWARKPAQQHTHTQCNTVPNQFCCHKPNLHQKLRNCWCFGDRRPRSGWMWTVDWT